MTTKHVNRALGLFPTLFPDELGGIQVSGRLAWDALADVALKRHLIVFAGAGVGPVTSRLKKIAFGVKAGANAPPSDLVLIWHLGLLKPLALAPSRGKVVVFLHGIECWQPNESLPTRRGLSKVDLFLSNSAYTWERFSETHPDMRGADHRVVHLGLGVPIAFEPDRPSRHTAVMIARLSKAEDYKGHREVIDAWPLVREQLPESQLVIIGDGDLRDDLRKMSEDLEISSAVRFLGSVDEHEKEEWLRRSRCLLMPSRGEGFGLVYLESMRIGRPCLVSEKDAGIEVVDPPQAGLSCNLNDRSDIADKIVRLLGGGPEWERLSIGARRRYETRFTGLMFQQRLRAAIRETV